MATASFPDPGVLSPRPGDAIAPPVLSTPVVIMGVAGCGKSAVGQLLAKRLGLPLIEGDDFHPPDNVSKMRQGIALTDQDRAGWLARLADELSCRAGVVLTCSALKKTYRDRLRQACVGLCFVHLAIELAEAQRRVAQRGGHFYPPSLVASQFDTLEDPSAEAGVLQLDGTLPSEQLVQRAAAWLLASGAPCGYD